MVGQVIDQWKMWVGVLGWIDTPLPTFIYILVLPLVVLIALFDHRLDIEVPVRARMISGLLFLGTWIVIYSLFFVTWTRAGFNPVEGVQGRYFIPFGALAFLPFYNRRLQPPRGWHLAAVGILAFILLAAIRTLLARYYAI